MSSANWTASGLIPGYKYGQISLSKITNPELLSNVSDWFIESTWVDDVGL